MTDLVPLFIQLIKNIYMKNNVSKSKTSKVTAVKNDRNITPVASTQTNVSLPKRATTPCSASTVTSEEIARRAYAIWEKQGCPIGKEEEHWLQAEKQLKSSHSFSE
jgi:hypothetical protein